MKDIYVVISATKSKMGKCIRLLTNNSYNHVSISFDEDLSDMVSFARYYREMPFYGGYVHESIERYNDAEIILYKITLDDESYHNVRSEVRKFEENTKDYVYHTINAFLCPFNKEIYIEHAYTCLSFVLTLLNKTQLKLPRIYSIKEFMKLIEPFKIYEGSLEEFYLKSDPKYLKNFSKTEIFLKTYSQQRKLLTRLIDKNV